MSLNNFFANRCLVFVCLCIYVCFMFGQNVSEIKDLPHPLGQVYFFFSFLSVAQASPCLKNIVQNVYLKPYHY